MKLWKLMLVAAMALVVVLALASCGCEHVYEEAITVAPTCTEEGVKTFTCTECGESYTEAVAAKGHTYTDKVVKPTCEAEGYTEHTCACGDTYKDSITEKYPHSFTEVVTAPTCGAEGYTTYTCYICEYTEKGNVTPKDENAHEYATILTELTAEQAAANPDAIGVAVEGCHLCGKVTGAEQQAALVYVNFDEDIDLETYVGSEQYQAYVTAGKFSSESQQKAVAILDAQKNLDCRKSSENILLTEDGRVTIEERKVIAGFINPFSLGAQTCAIPSYTIYFDVEINAIPALAEKSSKYAQLFGINSDKSYGNNRPICLAFSGVDLDTNPDDDVHTYELYAQSRNKGTAKANVATGYHITLGKEYSFKIAVNTVEGVSSYTVYVKAPNEPAYTEIATCEITPDNVDPFVTFITFSYYSEGAGNIFDNFAITTPLAK